MKSFGTTPQEERILRARQDGQTLQEIGSAEGITRERVRQLERQARGKLIRQQEQERLFAAKSTGALLSWAVTGVNFPPRIHNLLHKAKIRTIGDLLGAKRADLLNVKGCGHVALQLIDEGLRGIGLHWEAAQMEHSGKQTAPTYRARAKEDFDLTPQEERVLRAHQDGQTLQQIATAEGITRERVRQIGRQALLKERCKSRKS